MSENITLAPVSSFTNDGSAVATVNANSTIIATAFTDCLSLSGGQPNAMQSNLDMNSNQIINLPPPSTINSPARLIDVVSNPTLTIINPILPVLNLRTYGAVGNGSVDDTAAILAWLAAIQATGGPVAGYAPMGNYIFKSALSIGSGGKGDVTIYGDGPYTTVFTYSGASSSIDLFTIGDGITENHHWNVHDFKITSTTTMTAGTAFHTKLLGRSFIRNIIIDGQDGTGKLWNGFWFEAIDTTTLDGFEARGQNDGLRVNGKVGGPQADLFIRSGKIALCGNAGLRIGGAMGGSNIDDTDIIANLRNVVIDQTLVASSNNQTFFGKGCAIDSGTGTPNFSLLDIGNNSQLICTGLWIATNAGNGFEIGPGCTYNISFTGGFIGNHQHDGVYDGSGGTANLQFTGVRLDNNGGSGTGYGFNSSGPVKANISGCVFNSNVSGNISTGFNQNTAGGNTGPIFFYPFGNGLTIRFGSGPPTISAAQGSLYIRSDGSSTTTRMYVNTNGSTGWTNVVTSA